jgi:hypothetical protein
MIVTTAAQLMLARYGIPYTPDMHIRCIAHVVNLVVQAFLAAMDEADDPDMLDYFTLHKDAPLHYDVNEDKDQAELEAEADNDDPTMDVDEDPEPSGIEEDQGGLSPLKRVSPFVMSLCIPDIGVPPATINHDQDCVITPTPRKVSPHCSLNIQ